MTIIPEVLKLRNVYSNYISIIYQMKVKRKDKIDVILKNGEHFSIPPKAVIFIRELRIHNERIQNFNFDYDEGILSFNYVDRIIKMNIFKNGKFNGESSSFTGDYDFLGPFEGNTVIDIGSNIGDSSVWFAVQNAFKVLAIEPYKWSYEMAIQNIKLNNLEDTIDIIQAGYGQSGLMEIEDKISDIGTELKEFKGGIKIKILNLRDIIKFSEENFRGRLLLKMDCEGCEYRILQEPNEILSKFYKILIEYHYGYEVIKDKLEKSGFQVSFTEPHKWYDKKGHRYLIQGYIFAKRSF